jgi:hypothetical protein
MGERGLSIKEIEWGYRARGLPRPMEGEIAESSCDLN